MQLPDDRYADLVVDVLRDLVRMDTSNPPGNETEAAHYLAELLSPAGIDTRVIESEPGRGNLVARLRGSGEAAPLMFMGHLDVVAADPVEWEHHPFEADIHDGFVWGRGATDMKNMVAACAVTMLALAATKSTFRRDTLFVATADEERGGRMGMGWLAQHMPELFDVGCAINEGGGGTFRADGRLYYTCQTAEKGVCRTVWRASCSGGHGAYPRDDLATVVLSRAVSRIGDGHLGGRVTDTMAGALLTIAADQGDARRERTAQLVGAGRIEEALRQVRLDDKDAARARSLFYDTVSVTGLRAGDPGSINVIPPTAMAYVDGRILPGQTTDGLIAEIRERIGSDVEIEVYNGQYSAGLEASADAPIFRIISQVMDERAHARVVPWMCAGSTDAKHLVDLGVPVYGFAPTLPLPEGVEGAGAHAVDERVWVESLPFMVRVLYDIAYRYCITGD